MSGSEGLFKLVFCISVFYLILFALRKMVHFTIGSLAYNKTCLSQLEAFVELIIKVYPVPDFIIFFSMF